MRNGYGVCEYSTGVRYEGMVSAFNGLCVLKYIFGCVCVCVYGVCEYSTGVRYEGMVSAFNGLCVLKYIFGCVCVCVCVCMECVSALQA
jgi:hypothetical protein